MGQDVSAPTRSSKLSRTETVKPDFRNLFLACPLTDIEPLYDVVIIGSGYGGAIAASRAARAGQKVCILERGKEWRPGDFPETEIDAVEEVQMTTHGNPNITGHPTRLYDVVISPDVAVIQGCGLGGTSLINANVALDCDPRIFEDEVWPQELRENIENLTGIDRQHVIDMMKPREYPKDFPILPKLQAMGKAATHMVKDIEDLDVEDVFRRAPLFVNFNTKPKNHIGIPQPPCIGCGNCTSGCNTGAKNSLNMNYLPDGRAHGAKIFTEVEVRSITRDESTPDYWQVHYINYVQDSTEVKEQEHRVKASIVILGAGSLGSTNILLQSKKRGLDVSDSLGQRFSTNGDDIGFCYNSSYPIRPSGRILDEVEAKGYGPGPSVVGVIDMRNRPDRDVEEGYVLQDNTPPSCVDIPYKFLLKGTIGAGCENLLPSIDENNGAPGTSVDGGCVSKDMNTDERTPIYTEPSEDRRESGDSCTSANLRKDSGESGSGDRKLSRDKVWRELGRLYSADTFENTLAFLAMSNDKPDGELKLDEQNGRVWIHHPNVDTGPNMAEMRSGMKSASEGLNGDFLPSPSWKGVIPRLKNTRGIITVHPLGGCPMGKSGEVGVVNHAGQVFVGNGEQIHDGLYVIDGSIIPRSLGASPALTISMIAERCMRLLAAKYGWKIDYDKWKHMRRDTYLDIVKPGIRWNEKISGDLHFKNQPHHCNINLTIETRDVKKMIELDRNHTAQIFGTVTCPTLSKQPMTISNGRFQLYSKSKERIETREMVYKMVITSDEGQYYLLKGVKEVHKDSAFEMGMRDNTELNVIIHEGTDDTGRGLGAGKLYMTWKDFRKAMFSLEVIRTESMVEKLKWKAKFGRFFMGILWDTYGILTSASSPFNPDAPPREKRPLNLRGTEPEVFIIETGDHMKLALTHYKGGTKGPLILAHGMGVSSKIYTLDTIDKNFVEFMVENEFDVWVLEWRASVIMHAHSLQHTLDDVANNDFPAAVDKVLAETGAQDLLIMVHCVGSITFFMSMLLGLLEGKIRAIIASQVAFCTIPSTVNWLKAHTRVPNILHSLGVEGLHAYTDAKAGFISRAMNAFAETFSDVTTSFAEHCDSHVCHRITFMYGLMWEHENLNPLTHDTVHEIFGYGTATFFKHLSACMRKEYLVDANGKTSVYLPDFESRRHLESEQYMKHMGRLNMPILFYSGKENKSFPPISTLRAYARCAEAFPSQDYRRFEFPGYGHLDHMMGKNVEVDIFKKLLPFLNQYAHPDFSRRKTSGTPV